MAETKVSKAELYSYIAKAINRDSSSKLPPFPRRYFVDETSPGIRLYLRETDEPEVVEYVHEHCLANEIMRWIKDHIEGIYDGYNLEFKHAIDATRFWRARATPIGKIKSVCWLHDAGLTFRRLPWLRGLNTPTPTFNEMFSRISNGRSLKAFIGSLFFEESDMQQYVFLHGQGRNGKGALSRFLHSVFGNAYSSQTPPAPGDRFWTSMIIGKRLIVYPDCNNQTFWASGLFKSLTGGDPVRIEMKNQPAGTAIMVGKHMAISNERPNISSEEADQRRIIYCEIGLVKNDTDPKYGDKLWEEGGAFLYECIRIYQNDCPEFGSIPVKNDQLGDWVSTVEEEFETVFAHNFEVDVAGGYLLPAAFQDRLDEIWPRSRTVQSEFRKWLERRHSVSKRTDHNLPGQPKTYKGVRLIWEGATIRTSQQQQYDLQKTFPKNVDGNGIPPGHKLGHLVTVKPQGRDGRDI